MPKEDVLKNGDFQSVVPNTASGQAGDRGNPSNWSVVEPVSNGQVVTLSGGDLTFNRNETATGGEISQVVTGIANNSENITFSFTYDEVGNGGNPTAYDTKLHVTIVDKDGQTVVDQVVTDDITNFSVSFPANSTSYTLTMKDISEQTHNRDIHIRNVSFIAPVPCFTTGALIDTPDGPRLVEGLKVGDLVKTLDNGPQVIRWIGQRVVQFTPTSLNDKLRPIRIRAGALGENMPEADLTVSPQHRMLLRSEIAVRLFDCDEILTAAKNLIGLEGVTTANDIDEVTYIHILFDNHEVICANGAWSESLYLGKQAMAALSSDQLFEIMSIFPEVQDENFQAPQARKFAKASGIRKLIAHSQKDV